MATSSALATTSPRKRDDIGYGSREPFLIAMKKAREPVGEARDDYAIFAELRPPSGCRRCLHRRPRHHGLARASLWADCRGPSAEAGVTIPPFDAFWQAGIARPGRTAAVMLARSSAPIRRRIRYARRRARSKSIRKRSRRSATTTAPPCRGSSRSNGSARRGRTLSAAHAVRPAADKLHSQLDHSPHAHATKINRRAGHPFTLPMPPPAASPTATSCACSTIAAPACRRQGCRTGSGARRPPVDRRLVRPGRRRLEPALEKHGNPNALTLDIGASKLPGGCIAQTCLVEIERFDEPAPPVTAQAAGFARR